MVSIRVTAKKPRLFYHWEINNRPPAQFNVDPELGCISGNEKKTFDSLLDRFIEIHLPTVRIETARRYELAFGRNWRSFEAGY